MGDFAFDPALPNQQVLGSLSADTAVATTPVLRSILDADCSSSVGFSAWLTQNGVHPNFYATGLDGPGLPWEIGMDISMNRMYYPPGPFSHAQTRRTSELNIWSLMPSDTPGSSKDSTFFALPENIDSPIKFECPPETHQIDPSPTLSIDMKRRASEPFYPTEPDEDVVLSIWDKEALLKRTIIAGSGPDTPQCLWNYQIRACRAWMVAVNNQLSKLLCCVIAANGGVEYSLAEYRTAAADLWARLHWRMVSQLQQICSELSCRPPLETSVRGHLLYTLAVIVLSQNRPSIGTNRSWTAQFNADFHWELLRWESEKMNELSYACEQYRDSQVQCSLVGSKVIDGMYFDLVNGQVLLDSVVLS